MEQKRRGRPPGPKKEIKIELNTTEPKKRGRKAAEKPYIVFPDVVLEGEIEGTTTEKLNKQQKKLNFYFISIFDKIE